MCSEKFPANDVRTHLGSRRSLITVAKSEGRRSRNKTEMHLRSNNVPGLRQITTGREAVGVSELKVSDQCQQPLSNVPDRQWNSEAPGARSSTISSGRPARCTA